MLVRRTYRVVSVLVSPKILGRVIDPLGKPLDVWVLYQNLTRILKVTLQKVFDVKLKLKRLVSLRVRGLLKRWRQVLRWLIAGSYWTWPT